MGALETSIPGSQSETDTAKSHPTSECYTPLERAYSYFNETLFGGRLPGALITLRADRKSLSYFSPGRFGSHGGSADEIALNPVMFGLWPAKGVLSLLVHEMCHQAIRLNPEAKPSSIKPSYHSRELSDQMLAVGLCPSSTGAPGGKMTGECIGHYVISGGNFDLAADALLDESFAIVWYDRLLTDDQRKLPGLVTAAVPKPVSEEQTEEQTEEQSASNHPSPILPKATAQMDPQSAHSSFGVASTAKAARISQPPTSYERPTSASGTSPLPIMTSYDIDRLRTSLKASVAADTSVVPLEAPGDAIALPPRSTSKSKIAYDCPACSATLWGKPALSVYCGCTEPKPEFAPRAPLQSR